MPEAAPQRPRVMKTPPRRSWEQRLAGCRKSPFINAWSPAKLEPNQLFFPSSQ